MRSIECNVTLWTGQDFGVPVCCHVNAFWIDLDFWGEKLHEFVFGAGPRL